MSSEWVEKRLGDLGKTQTGTTPKTSQSDNFGNFIPFITPADFYTNGHINVNNKGLSEKGLNGSRLIDDGSVLMVCIGATIGKCGFNEKAIAANQQINALTPDSGVSPKFLYYQMLTPLFQKAVLHSSGQATLPIINKTKWSNLLVSIPSLSEQKRIVAILDEAFAGISQAVANTEKNLANARELFESYLNNVFTQKGEGWVEKPVSEIADCCLGKMLDKKKNKGSPKPYLRNINVRWFIVEINDLLEMRFEKSEEDRYSVKNGDLVICEGGYPGRAAIWEGDEPIYFQKAIHRVRAKHPIHNRWILYFLYLSDVTGELRQYFTGTGIQHFTGKALKGFRLPLAPDEEIVAYLDKFDSLFEKTRCLEKIYQQKLTVLTELKQSILQKAFTGELTAEIELQQANG